MWFAFRFRAACAGAYFLLSTAAIAAVQVVGDEACEKFAADIASFATCDDGRVTRPVDEARPAVATGKSKPESGAATVAGQVSARGERTAGPRAALSQRKGSAE